MIIQSVIYVNVVHAVPSVLISVIIIVLIHSFTFSLGLFNYSYTTWKIDSFSSLYGEKRNTFEMKRAGNYQRDIWLDADDIDDGDILSYNPRVFHPLEI